MADPIDPYKILQVDSEAEDEVIQAAYRRLARKYHPDLAETPEAAARMAAINAAWELIGDPAARARSTGSAEPRPRGRRPGSPSRARRQARRVRVGRTPARPTRSEPPPTQRPPEVVSRDWTSGRSTQGGGFDESMRAAEGFGAAGPPPGTPVGDGPQLRPLRRLVARRGRAPRHRVHRVARPRPDRAELPAGGRRAPALERPADARPTPMPRTVAGCTAGARRSDRSGVGPGRRRARQRRRSSRSAGSSDRRPGRSSFPGPAA